MLLYLTCRWEENRLILVIKHAVAVALEIGVCNLTAKLCADALVVFRPFQTAGTVATGAFETLFYGLHHIFIFI